MPKYYLLCVNGSAEHEELLFSVDFVPSFPEENSQLSQRSVLFALQAFLLLLRELTALGDGQHGKRFFGSGSSLHDDLVLRRFCRSLEDGLEKRSPLLFGRIRQFHDLGGRVEHFLHGHVFDEANFVVNVLVVFFHEGQDQERSRGLDV